MKKQLTKRGFGLVEFRDGNEISCSLQESSSGTLIWFGCDKGDPKQLVKGEGWVNIKMPKKYLNNTRMHLTQQQVKELLPYLNTFVETGCI